MSTAVIGIREMLAAVLVVLTLRPEAPRLNSWPERIEPLRPV